MKSEKRSGVLLHPTSLPSRFPVGDFGNEAYEFVDKISEAGFSLWQILPINPVGWGNSPYMSNSSMAFNPILISPDKLVEYGWLDSFEEFGFYEKSHCDFENAEKFKERLLHKSFNYFTGKTKGEDIDKYRDFIDKFSYLEDVAIFEVISKHNGNEWGKWPEKLRDRDKEAILDVKKRYAEEIEFFLYGQFVFYTQWKELKEYANKKGVSIIGDIPIYVSLNSSDVWLNREVFDLDPKTLKPKKVAGVPPDYFSATGQLWGNPLYQWFDGKSKKLNQATLSWWIKRFDSIFSMVDVIRVDHFRGFESFWAVKYGELTAIEGKWEKGPGKDFFLEVFKKEKGLDIIAEDLGVITEKVERLRDDLKLPGMKILQFAFSGPDNFYLPGNYETSNCVVYTGTHDNNTTKGWFKENTSNDEKHFIWQYFKREYNEETITPLLIETALASCAKWAVIPMQDILNLDSHARMNTPSSTNRNWLWKMKKSEFDSVDVEHYRELNRIYNRLNDISES